MISVLQSSYLGKLNTKLQINNRTIFFKIENYGQFQILFSLKQTGGNTMAKWTYSNKKDNHGNF